jgi:hypothetical protein
VSRKDNLIESIVEIENQIDHVFNEDVHIIERIKDLDLMSIPGLEKRLKERSNYFCEKLE